MTTLTFQNKTLSVINQNNQTWLNIIEIGKALGYSNPLISINNLYNRHQDEFTPCMTALVDMPTAGGVQKVRIFSLRGCHLIGMLSHTKVAKDFRRWVLDILDKETVQPKQPALPLADYQQDEEALQIIVNLYHSLREGHEMAKLVHQSDHYWIKERIDTEIGGHYFHNLHHPAKNALDKAKRYINATSERIAFVKGMLSLLS